MPLRMNRDSFVCTCAILIVFIAEIGLFSASTAQARSAQGSAAAKATFQSKCAMCHGPDGGGSEVGKSMKVPDLRSPAVQKLPDAQLAEAISDGKGRSEEHTSELQSHL